MSTDSRAGPTPAQGFVFKAIVDLHEQQLRTRDMALPIVAGMEVSAEIIQGRRSVMAYLLSPVQKVVSEAGMERWRSRSLLVPARAK